MADILLFPFLDFMKDVKPAARSGMQEPHRLVRPHESATKRRRQVLPFLVAFTGVASRP